MGYPTQERYMALYICHSKVLGCTEMRGPLIADGAIILPFFRCRGNVLRLLFLESSQVQSATVQGGDGSTRAVSEVPLRRWCVVMPHPPGNPKNLSLLILASRPNLAMQSTTEVSKKPRSIHRTPPD